MPQPELYIWHDRQTAYTVSRFYFCKELSRTLFRSQIQPVLRQLPRVANDSDVRGYRNYVVVHWDHVGVVPFGSTPHDDALLNVERTTEMVLTRAFGWRASILRCVKDASDATRIALELNLRYDLELNWSKGQCEL